MQNKIYLFILSFFLALSSFAVVANEVDTFSFMALGDTAYKDNRYNDYHSLIDRINKQQPDFTIHIGDTLGYQLCSDDSYAKITQSFNRFENPLVYTPGDNEWADCYKPDLSSDSHPVEFSEYRIERLDTLRKLYFSNDQSLGKNTIKQNRQSDLDKKYPEFSENRYWIHKEVLFATFHSVGSNDGFHPYLDILTKESMRRRGANYAWIMGLIKIAKDEQVKAVVIATHAELFNHNNPPKGSKGIQASNVRGGKLGPYIGYVHALSTLAYQVKQPILFIHGDYHKFIIDRPFLKHGGDHEPKDLLFTNFTRLQVYGDPEDKAVKITVDTKSKHVFSYTPMY